MLEAPRSHRSIKSELLAGLKSRTDSAVSGTLPGMTAPPKTGKKSAKKTPAKPPKVDGRKTSLFTDVGEEAKAKAQRALLLKTLEECQWSLTTAVETLGMGSRANIIRALKTLAPDEYAAAKTDGRIKPGKRLDS